MRKERQESFIVPNLKLKEVTVESWRIYRTGFKQFIYLSCIIFIVGLASRLISGASVWIGLNQYGLILLLKTLIVNAVFILEIYLAFRVGIAVYLIAEKIMKNEEFSAMNAFEIAKNSFWRYVTVNIKFVAILIIPVICGVLSYKYIQSHMLKYLILSILFIPSIYIIVRFYFAPLSSVIKKEKHDYFETSKQLIKGDFWRVIFIIAITDWIFMVPYHVTTRFLFDINKMGEGHKFFIVTMSQLFYVFTLPFSYSFSVVTFFALKRNKRIG